MTAGEGHVGVVLAELRLDVVLPHFHRIGRVDGQAGVRLSGLGRGLGHLAIVPENVTNHLGSGERQLRESPNPLAFLILASPVRLVDHQTVDAVVVSLVVVEPHPAVLVGVGVPGDVHPGPVYDVGLLLRPVVWPSKGRQELQLLFELVDLVKSGSPLWWLGL